MWKRKKDNRAALPAKEFVHRFNLVCPPSSASGGKGSGPPLESYYMDSLQSAGETGSSGDLSSADSQKSFVIKPDELTNCLMPDGQPEKLGEGGFSVVYKGLYDGEVVAVKVVKQLTNQQNNMRAILHEVAHNRKCRHQNITKFIGAAFPSFDSVLLVFEFMEHGNLFDLLKSDQAKEYLWNNRGKYIAREVACGLTYLQSLKIIHSDIKSPNIMLNKNGIAKIGDMGMSKFQDKTFVSVVGQMGSFAWAAPELLVNSRVDEKVDVYSLGVVMWELITRESPIRGQLGKLRVPEDCSEDIANIVSDCMQYDPNHRPSAEEVYQRLCKALD